MHIRETLARKLREHHTWDCFARNRSATVERQIGDAVSALFFHSYNFRFSPPTCYVPAPLVRKTDVFLPVLRDLASEAPTLMVGTEATTLLVVAPHATQLPFVLSIGQAWIAARADDSTFWVDYGIGRKLCQWFEAMLELEPKAFQTGAAERQDVDQILAALVRAGVSEAGRLEAKLAGNT